MIDIDELEALHAATGSDGWKHVPDADEYGNHTNERIIVGPDLDGATLADAECICAAHNLMPEIIAELKGGRALMHAMQVQPQIDAAKIRMLETEVERLRTILSKLRDVDVMQAEREVDNARH